MGTTGLLNVPSADMQKEGTFMGGGNFLPTELTPAKWGYNTGNYFLNITFVPFFEVVYRATLLKERTGFWNQDRSVSLRLRGLKEGKWWPSIVVGSNDVVTTRELNPLNEAQGNRYFSSIYAVGTKHLAIGRGDVGLTFGAVIPMRRDPAIEGLFGGISYRLPSLPVTLMGEYDTKGVNLGGAVHLFGHVSAHVFAYDFRAVAGGLRYEFHLIR
jgi:hypothetical protein